MAAARIHAPAPLARPLLPGNEHGNSSTNLRRIRGRTFSPARVKEERMPVKLDPSLEGLLRLRDRLAVGAGGRFAGNPTEVPPQPIPRHVMGQRGKAELWLTPSSRCYSFESRCHDWRFFSLHRGPYPRFEWSSCFLRTSLSPLTASPCGRLSRPRSTISQSDFRQAIGSSSRSTLVGPYKVILSLTDLPCSQ